MKKKIILSCSVVMVSFLLGAHSHLSAETMEGLDEDTVNVIITDNSTSSSEISHSSDATSPSSSETISSNQSQLPSESTSEEASSEEEINTVPSVDEASKISDSSSKDTTTAQQKATSEKKEYITVYRLYNKRNMEHLYTTDKNEMTTLLKIMNSDWKYEGGAWMSPKTAGASVYRVYNPKSGEHLYTKDGYEAKVLSSKHGWKNEGRKFFSDNSGISVYRLFNAQAGIGAHFVTRDAYEKKVLTSKGWKYEGIAWKSSNTPLVVDYTPPKTPVPPKPHAKSPVYFSQLNSRWSRVPLNNSTVGVSGCVPTSLAMIFKGSYGMNVDPGTAAIRANGISHQSFGLSGKDLLNTVKAYGRSVEQISSQNRAITLLKSGYPLVFYINVGIGHAVVVYGYNNGTVNVFDPYNRQFYPSGRASLTSIWNKPSADPMDWDAGRPVFAVK